jgi:hypothetical protein
MGKAKDADRGSAFDFGKFLEAGLGIEIFR